MYTITLNGTTFSQQKNESVLDTLLRHNQPVPHSCRHGVCQSCLMRSLNNPPPVSSQNNLKDTLQHQNYFLPCVCIAEHNMTVALPDQQTQSINVRVIKKQKLTADIVHLVLQLEDNFHFFAGQFVNLTRADGLVRSYSIANIPQANNILEFHIRKLPNGEFSQWVYNDLQVGDQLTTSEARGNCFYLSGREQQPLLLIGTGTGLAPLLGIVHDALAKNHTAPIHLFHGSRNADGLYFVNELRALSEKNAHFYYTPCLSGKNIATDFAQGRAHEVALATLPTLQNWRVFLCGHPEMISQTRKNVFLKGAKSSDIYVDAFHVQQKTL